MALKFVLESLAGIEEATAALYKKGNDGRYRLDLEDDPAAGPLKALNEERENVKKLKEQMAAFKDLDPKKYEEMAAKLQELEDKKLIDAGKIDEVVSQRTEAMRTKYESQVKAQNEAFDKEREARAKAEQRYLVAQIERGVMEAATTVAQPKKGAMPDILSRAGAVWQMDENGEPVAMKPDKTPMYSADGKTNITFAEWMRDFCVKEAPHLFEGSTGGDANKRNTTQTHKVPGSNDENLSPNARYAQTRKAMLEGNN